MFEKNLMLPLQIFFHHENDRTGLTASAAAVVVAAASTLDYGQLDL